MILKVGEDEIAEGGDVHGAMEGLKEGDSVAVAVSCGAAAPMTLRMEVDGAPATGFYFRQAPSVSTMCRPT